MKMSPSQVKCKQRPVSSSSWQTIFRFLIVYLAVSSFFMAVASAQTFYEDKKNDPNNRPFYMGSRYGRSGQQTKVMVAPRTDRFFMGSRYGKRAGYVAESVDETNPNEVPLEEPAPIGAEEIGSRPEGASGEGAQFKVSLKCAYLGIGNLYRCFHRDQNTLPGR